MKNRSAELDAGDVEAYVRFVQDKSGRSCHAKGRDYTRVALQVPVTCLEENSSTVLQKHAVAVETMDAWDPSQVRGRLSDSRRLDRGDRRSMAARSASGLKGKTF